MRRIFNKPFFVILVICMVSACSVDDVAKKEAENFVKAFVQYDFISLNDVTDFKYNDAEDFKNEQISSVLTILEADYPEHKESITPLLSEMYDAVFEKVQQVRTYTFNDMDIDAEDYEKYICKFTVTTEKENFIQDVMLSSFYKGVEITPITDNSSFDLVSESAISALNNSLEKIETCEENVIITVYVNDPSYLAGRGMISMGGSEWESIRKYLKD